MAITTADAAFLDAALELAARGPVVDPNPRVGCVLVNDGAVVGRGFHRGAGTAHAEAVALTDAGEKARGATAFVTLEPCNHHGRTPACAGALIDAGVVRVVYAAADPSPEAAGGARRLRAAGIDPEVVVSGVDEQGVSAPTPAQLAQTLAEAKADAVAAAEQGTDEVGRRRADRRVFDAAPDEPRR